MGKIKDEDIINKIILLLPEKERKIISQVDPKRLAEICSKLNVILEKNFADSKTPEVLSALILNTYWIEAVSDLVNKEDVKK